MGIRKMNALKTMAALGALALAAWAAPASAVEEFTPYLSGNSVGAPAGASPPPGFYGVNSVVLGNGPVQNNSGDQIPVRASVTIEIPVLVYVPNFKVFGATYNVAAIQPYSQLIIPGNTGGSANGQGPGQGLFNTILVPYNLSWMVAPGWFVSTGLGLYIPDGTYSDQAVPCVNSVGSIIPGSCRAKNNEYSANNYWTFEPDVAVSYLGGGWNLTGKFLFDFNTKNTSDNYTSGTVFYIDWTAAHKFGKWEAGVGGNFTVQLSNDTCTATVVGNCNNGNKETLVTIGPVVSYDFGPVTLQSKVLFTAEAYNTVGGASVYLTAIWGF